ncbi:MAG: SCP2 sterol-binding domain-containing protein [Desulfamplus sp.]|nr:SCP2 sterol-binding domain-containing protein [Desulfamplus sp.]
MTNPFLQEKVDDILDATILAGKELVSSMKISPETMERITQPLVETQAFIEMGNLFWKTCIAEGVTPKEFYEKQMVLCPDSLKTFMLMLPFGLNSEAVGGRKAVLQFKFSGAVEGTCYFTIEKGKIDANAGTLENADITIVTPFDVWMDIMTGKANGQQLFMEQKYKVDGDILLMLELFKGKAVQ